MYVNFYGISSTKNGDQLIQIILGKVKPQPHLLSDFHEKVDRYNLCLDNTKYKISLNSFDQFLSNTCHKIFVTHTHRCRSTDIFPEIVKSCSGHIKTYKPHRWRRGSAQNWKTGDARFKPRSRLST